MQNPPLTSAELAAIVAGALADKKGSCITAYDTRAKSNVTDFYVLATGLNPPHLKALFNETRLRLKALGLNCYRKAGTPDSGWIVADYIDVVVHLFNQETRRYYALDALWKDMPQLDIGQQTPDDRLGSEH